MPNMKAILLLRERHVLDRNTFAELRVWKVPEPVPGSAHNFKYSLAFIVDGICVVRYDNEQGKGDHCHNRTNEVHYDFSSPEQLIADFWASIDSWRSS
jgi:hypothetical protein